METILFLFKFPWNLLQLSPTDKKLAMAQFKAFSQMVKKLN